MNVVLLYLLLAKATCMGFSGLASLPFVRKDLVERHAVLTDTQLNTAVAAGRSGPGPLGLYVVCVGYQVAGWPGAGAGFLAMVTPAFFVIGLLRWLGRYVEVPSVRRIIHALLIAAAGLLAATSVDLAGSAVRDPFTAVVAAAACGVFAFTRIDSAWVMLAAAAVGLVRAIAA